MKPAPFAYAAPATVEECVALLEEHGEDAKPLAGGQSLIPLMNLRLASPELLVDLRRIDGLDGIARAEDRLVIGGLVRHAALARSGLVQEACPLLARAASLVGYPSIRARGTIGGSLAHADPAAELPLAALTLDAELVAAGPGGRRSIAAADFFQGYFTTALRPAEVLVEVRVLLGEPGECWAFEELARKSGDFALVAAAATATVSGGVVTRARIGVGGAADRPLRAPRAEAALAGGPLDAAAVATAAELAAADAVPETDGRERTERRGLVEVLVRRALASLAIERGGGAV